SSLTEITIPDTVTSIGCRAFENCTGLTEITIPDTVTSIEWGAFSGCRSLTAITIPSSVTIIEEGVFSGCNSLTEITIPDGVTSIGTLAFENCTGLTEMVIPDSVTDLGIRIFDGCTNLTNVTIGSGVSSYLGNVTYDMIFWANEIVFWGCPNLANITVSEDNENYSSVDGVLYNKDQTELIVYPAGKEGEFIIPDGVITIAGAAFEDCDKLTVIVIPDSVTTIEEYAFRWCDNLISVLISDGVTFIGNNAFCYCHALTDVTIGTGIAIIEWDAFEECNNLTTVKFEGDAPECDYAFYGTPAIIYYNEGTSGWTNPWCDRPAITEGEIAIATQPQSQVVLEGDSVTFSVTAGSTEELSYQWYKDDTAIAGATEATFTIDAVSTEDAGSYIVTVSNTENSMDSDEAVLTVMIPKPVQLLLDFQFNEGKGFTSASSVGSAVLGLSEAADSTDRPFGSTDSPSGQDDDFSAEFNGIGWAIGTFDDEPIDLTQPVTWEAWINVDAERVSSYEDYFRLANTFKIGADHYHRFEVTLCGIVDITSDAIEMTAGTGWTHVAAVWEPGVGVTFFQDGIEKDKVTISNYANDYRSNILSVGSDNSGGSIFKGKIDRMRIYNRILTDTELDFDAVNPKPIGDAVLAWDFDSETLPFVGAGSNAVNLTSGIDSGVNDRTIEWSTSTPARDMDPSLTDDFSVFIDNKNSDNPRYGTFDCDAIDFGDTSDSSFTLEAWVKGASSHYMKQVFFQTWSSSNGKCPRLSLAINSDCSVLLTTLGAADIYTNAYIPQDGGWHHVACAFDQLNKKLMVYVDGELADTRNLYNANVNFATISYDSNLGTIGAEHNGYAPFTGCVDRVRLWTGVLRQDQLDYVKYEPVIKNVALIWDEPESIAYGTPLSEEQLNAVAVGPNGEYVEGLYTYMPEWGEILPAGIHELTVFFTPDDPNYEFATASVELYVNGLEPTITWADPEPIIYGTALGDDQLNATADVPGMFTYNIGYGAVLDVGMYVLSAFFTPDDPNYESIMSFTELTVIPAIPTVIWADPAPVTYGTTLSVVQLNAMADVQGSFTYTPDYGTVLSAGIHTLTAVFTPDSPNYNSTESFVELIVNKAIPTITWVTPEPISAGTPLSAEQLNATANMPGTFEYTPAS
ncbi:MAG: leucine-rich repeat protein, partial [Verrucomicrobia bacterium]|nr:leucine-rich repeat protein [Verrucomicrobiota bacterium]